MILGKTSYILAAFLIFYSLSKYRIFITARKAAITNFLLLIIFFSSLSTVLEYIASSSGGYIGHIILIILQIILVHTVFLVASLLTLLYSYVYYFDISVSSVSRNTMKVVTYLYLKAKYKLGILYDKANLKLVFLNREMLTQVASLKRNPMIQKLI